MKINILIKNKKLNIKSISRKTNIKYTTLLDKIKGKTEFTISEAFKLQELVFPEYSLFELFYKN